MSYEGGMVNFLLQNLTSEGFDPHLAGFLGVLRVSPTMSEPLLQTGGV